MAIPVVAFAQSPTDSDASSSPRKLAVSQSDILECREIQANGQSVTIQKLKPQALLPAPNAPAAPAAPGSELQEKGKPAPQFFFVGATVYHSRQHPLETRTLLRFQDESSQAITCWSTADWNWLTGIAEFEGKDGQRFAYMLSLSNSEVADWNSLQQQEKQFPLPHFQQNHAEFVVVEGTPSPKSLATLQTVHDRFNADGNRMKAEFEAREQARRAQEARAAERASQPKKLVIRTWRMDSAGQANVSPKTDASK